MLYIPIVEDLPRYGYVAEECDETWNGFMKKMKRKRNKSSKTHSHTCERR